MRATFLTATTIAFTAVSAPLEAQDLADRVNSARADVVRISFPTRPEICGDGKSISETTADGYVTHTFWSGGYSINTHGFWDVDCEQGPMRLVVERRNGRITELRAAVGVDWLPDAPGVDIGTFSGREAANWLLDVAEVNDEVSSIAFLAANAAADAPIADRLLVTAANESLDVDVRQRAIRWVNRAAVREGMEGQADRLLRSLALARADNVEVRERAIRSLRETTENDAWLRDQYSDLDRTQLKERVIRRIGESSSRSNAAWLRSVALERNERVDLRERALRVIGEMTDGHAEIRDMYARLDRSELKERALRVVGEKGSPEGMLWIRQVAADENERTSVRERAIRILGESTSLATMQQLYRDADASALKDRILRMVGEQRTAESAEWLEQVATDSDERIDLRDRAIKLLGEYESLSVRGLFETLDHDDLRVRALRITAERSGAGTTDWLTGIATSTRYSAEVRDRAVRLLGERAIASSELAALYDEVTSYDLRRRVIRILAERGDDVAADKLRDIMETDPSRDLRRYASRRLAEMR
jgi:hypothetical protein